jgi:cytochrome bd ubiquinol oxidase subunit I
MFGIDALGLARFQFAFTVSFHIVFPAFSIGLASYLAVLLGLHLKTRNQLYLRVFDYWKTIFAVTFGMGVVSGLVMSYQFGTNWSVFSERTGPVLGPLMGYEVLTAFFLEAGFLGIMLFGRQRVGEGLHALATFIVAFGTLISATWILSVNSWMQTPAGYSVNAAGQFVPENWLAIIFNPSFPYRLVHMVLAAYLTTALVVAAVAAFHLLKKPANEAARLMLSMAMWMLLFTAPVQLVAGDMHGLNTLAHQPAKIAAMEGHYETQTGAPLILFGLPDDAAEKTRYAIEIPKLGSLILTHHLDGEVKGLKEWPPSQRPSAEIIFWTFRIMVLLGFAMLGLGLWGGWHRWRGNLYETPLLLRASVLMGPAGFVAVVCGWITTEAGRQPWTVYGLLTTAESASPLQATAVTGSLLSFIIVYFTVFGAGVFYLLRLMRSSPDDGMDIGTIGPTRTSPRNSTQSNGRKQESGAHV